MESQAEVIEPPQSSIKRKSSMWTYFSRKSANKVVCKLCQREFKYSNNTSNMKDHMIRKHTAVLVTNPSSSQTEASKDDEENKGVSENTVSTYNQNSSRKKMLDSLFIKMIAVDMEPLKMAEHEGLREFVAGLDSRYQMPGRTTVSTKLLPNLYMKMKLKLIEILGKIKYIAITTDTWTSKNNQCVLALTCHFIMNNRLYCVLLAAKVLEGFHDAASISEVIASILAEWQCSSKVVAIVTDNAAVMIKVADILKLRHLPCFAHNLNLVMKDVLHESNELKELVEKCTAIVSYYKRSTKASDKLKMIQRDLKKKELKLIQNVETRWNSVLKMLRRITEVKDELTLAISQNPHSPPNLTATEYSLLNEVKIIFEPIETATESISGEEYVTISLIIPLIKGMLLNIAEQERQQMSDSGKAILEILKATIIKRLKPYESRTPCIISTLLNPHFKKLGFKTDTEVERAINYVQKEYSSHLLSLNRTSMASESIENAEETEIPAKKSKLSSLLSFLHVPTLACGNATSNAIVDIRQYVEKPIIAQTEYPIEFWAYSQSELKHIALRYLCIPGTSVPAERIFSKAGQIISDRRSRLGEKHINELLFIKQNKKILDT